MDIEEALEFAAKGEAILFLGAGFSFGAKNLKNFSFKTGPKLNELLCSQLKIPIETPLEDASDFYADKYGIDELIKIIRQEYTVKEIKEHHKVIASLPWERIYTTNYDNVFEEASKQSGRLVVPISPNSKIKSTPKQDTLCIHLNGYINNLDRETIWDSFKLTGTSYSSASIEKSEWATLFREDIRFAKAVFFIGYSLYDLDIKRILRSDENLIKKTFFVQHENIDVVTESRIKKFGMISKLGSEGFGTLIKNGNYASISVEKELNIGRSIKEIYPIKHKIRARDEQFINLLMLGEFIPELTKIESTSESFYYCRRYFLDEIVEKIEENRIDSIVLHSNIANGKTISILTLSELLLEKNWRVFHATEQSKYSESELRAVAEIPNKVVLIIDDYVNWLENIKGLTNIISDQFKFVFTARTNSHDIFEDRLADVIYPLDFDEYNLDYLNRQEIKWWVETLNLYGLWGNMASLSYTQKEAYIFDKCDRQIHGILLKLLESPNIKSRFTKAALEIKEDPFVENICITIFALNSINEKPSIDLLFDIWGFETFSKKSVKSNAGLLNFIDLTKSEIRVKSSVASEYLLKNNWSADKIVEILLKIADVANKNNRVSIKYKNLFKSLLRFANIQSALPNDGKREAVINYYESLKLIGSNKTFPLFWLQYAIAVLVNNDLVRAELYFETSYSLAEKADWNTYQIDNHYARFLLVKATEDADFDDAMRYFRKARTLINRQIRADHRHYPFRVASSYQSFYDRFESQFSQLMCQEILEASQTVAKRISELSTYQANNKYIKNCLRSMEYIISKTMKKIEED